MKKTLSIAIPTYDKHMSYGVNISFTPTKLNIYKTNK